MLCLASPHPWDGFPGGSVVENLLTKSHKKRGFHPWVRETPLEKEMAAHSSILAWEIPWTEEGAWRAKSMRS